MTLKTLMLVDDSEADHLLAKIAITQYDKKIHIIQAYDGAEALKMLSNTNNQPDLILLDINMPGMGGHEFLEHYNKLGHHGKVVVMLTSSEQPVDVERCKPYGFVKQFMTKPLSSEKLAELKALL